MNKNVIKICKSFIKEILEKEDWFRQLVNDKACDLLLLTGTATEQTVSLPLSEIENMEKQIDLWEKESISERGSVAQNLKTKLSETKEKLDKLVSLYLDGDIEREIYLQRKDLLLRQKAKFEESFKDFGQQRKNWVEPLRSFVLSLREAVILEKGENYFAWKEFFQKIGSNPVLKDKTLSCNWGELWEFTASAVGGKGFEKIDSAILASAKSLRFLNSDNVSFGGHYTKKFGLISSRILMTNESAPPPLVPLACPAKNILRFSNLARDQFFLLKG